MKDTKSPQLSLTTQLAQSLYKAKRIFVFQSMPVNHSQWCVDFRLENHSRAREEVKNKFMTKSRSCFIVNIYFGALKLRGGSQRDGFEDFMARQFKETIIEVVVL